MFPKSLSPEQIERLKKETIDSFIKAANAPFSVAVVGQTGVGKSSLINSLFNTDLKTDAVKPCTMAIERVSFKGEKGGELWFYDLPGIGESASADARYMEDYKQKLLEADVVLWCIHTDNRSVTFDSTALNKLLSSFPVEKQAQLMSKLTFVLTKADTLIHPPWVLAKLDSKWGMFLPSQTTRDILNRKAEYYQETFLHPYKYGLVSRTYNEGNFKIDDPRFSWDNYSILFQGFMDSETLSRLQAKFPQFSRVFQRLYNNYQVIPCSANFRYNLNQLMVVIVNKMGTEAVSKFQRFLNQEEIDKVPFAKAREYNNLVVIDANRNRKLFDLKEMRL
ncbi:MAG: 50S ribosome-binding GTPase [Nostocaceae cyanobacterium]|nr:50S ribosome-binding GTPase [Nostocaceae cyanobacterium]